MSPRAKVHTVYHTLFSHTSGAWITGQYVIARIFNFGDSMLVYYEKSTGKVYLAEDISVAIFAG